MATAETEPRDDRLGRLLSTHPVAGWRYLRTGGVALACVAGAVLLAVLLITHPDLVSGRLLAFVALPALAGLPVAVIQLTRAGRNGRKGGYELYENGLAHRTTAGTRSWTWQEVAVLHADREALDAAPAQTPIDKLGRRLGWHFRCVVRFTDGARIALDGYTTDGPVIARALLTHRPDAVPQKGTARGSRVLLCTLPLAIAAFAVPLVLMYRYMTSTGADDIGGGTTVALALGMLICVIGLVMSLVVFVMMLIASLRTPGDGRRR